MSTITAGITVPTGLTLTSDTTGGLTFQVSGTVTALSIGAGATTTITNAAITSLTISNPSTFPAGSASAPAVTTTGDLDTGIYFPAANEVAVTTGGTVATAFNSNGLFFRNRIINGDMRIDQRNAGASVTPSGGAIAFVVDRFFAYPNVASKLTAQQNAGSVAPPAGFKNYFGVTSSSAYSPAAGDVFPIGQLIEGFNVADLGWGASGALPVTLSFWVRSSLTGTFGGSLGNSAFDRSYPFTYAISAANTWEYKTVTIPGDTTGTWLTNNGVGLRVYLSAGNGTTYAGTAGAWAGTAYYSASSTVNLVGTNGATLYVTGVQLETGSVATPFERRPYGTELALCQRYFQQISSGGIGSAHYTTAVTLGGQFPVAMRATPTASLTGTFRIDQVGVAGFTQSASNITSINGGNSATAWSAAFANFTGLTQFSPVTMSDTGGHTTKLQFSIEL